MRARARDLQAKRKQRCHEAENANYDLPLAAT
jgi:hypothetical protein